MNQIIKSIIYSLLGAVIITALSLSSVISPMVNTVNDALYQRVSTPDERIVIIGVDSYAIEQFGAWPWDRSIMADAINYLNQDEENAPAVIGIDVVYDIPDNSSDDKLVAAAEKLGNVVIGTYVTFTSEIVNLNGDNFYIDTNATSKITEPFEDLKNVTEQGHVNAMLDSDGVLRHALWQIDTSDGESIPAFNRVIAEKYTETMELEAIKTPPVDAENRWYVLQQSLPGAYSDGISIADLVNESVNPQFFADKIVLIGPYDASFKDEYITAIDHASNMAGVEYQANAIGALLSNNMKYEVQIMDDIVLFLITFLLFFLLPRAKVFKAGIISIITIGLWFVICMFVFEIGYIINMLYIPIAVLVAFIFTIAQNYFSELSKRKYIASTFKRYVAPEIVNELLKDNSTASKLGGETADVAVLFVDIRGFTSLSTKLAANVVVEILNEVLKLTTDCILSNKGTLDKYIGDCTMAFWGAPLKQDDHIFKAVDTAIKMQAGMQKLSNELLQKTGERISFGIGIDYGSAIVGNIGVSNRMDYTVIGDAVNTASRLESNAAPNEILTSEKIAKALDGRVKFTCLGTEIKLKGKPDDFKVYRVEGLLQ